MDLEKLFTLCTARLFVGKSFPGVGGTPLHLLCRDVPQDRVWFSGINLHVCVLNRVFIPWTSSRVLLIRVA